MKIFIYITDKIFIISSLYIYIYIYKKNKIQEVSISITVTCLWCIHKPLDRRMQ